MPFLLLPPLPHRTGLVTSDNEDNSRSGGGLFHQHTGQLFEKGEDKKWLGWLGEGVIEAYYTLLCGPLLSGHLNQKAISKKRGVDNGGVRRFECGRAAAL